LETCPVDIFKGRFLVWLRRVVGVVLFVSQRYTHVTFVNYQRPDRKTELWQPHSFQSFFWEVLGFDVGNSLGAIAISRSCTMNAKNVSTEARD